MQPLTAAELLAVWEQGYRASATERALLLLTAACPEATPDDLAQLSVGRRDGRLLRLRTWQFGDQLACIVTCPACYEQLDLTFNTNDIQVSPPATQAKPLRLRRQGYDIRFRLPNTLDLLALSQTANGHAALLNRCVLTARYKGEATAVTELPDTVVTAVAERMAQADPQAEVQLALTCPACQDEWLATFDILSFFWLEINAWALRILQEVHRLASAYGWREADILALSSRRRQFYLEMIGSL
jgi:hypothetical protein